MKNFEIITYRCDTSIKGTLTYYVKLKVNFNNLYHKNKVIIVLRYEQDDITLKKQLGDGKKKNL